ncbi:MAG: deoxyribose-phosphate aldolase [Anaerolineae bacterium]
MTTHHTPSTEQIARMMDHTLLRPDATQNEVFKLCNEALQYHFASVCVNPTWVALCADMLASSPVKVCTVIGFPLGATLTDVKAYEAAQAIGNGAREVDMVQNIGALKSGDYQLVADDVAAVVRTAHDLGATVKVIIETALLTEEEKIKSCEIAQAAGADYVKTSTGFAAGGATASDVALMRRVVGSSMGVKASGGIRTAQDALAMLEAGASRLGVSASIKILDQLAGGSA